MKIIKSEETSINKNSENCICNEYDFQNNDLDLGICKINGRYPDTGFVRNRISKELIYVLDGSGKLVFEKEEINFKEQDAILIEPMENYYFDGDCKLALICNPAWKKEFHENIEGE